jgi:hypothetical protein
MQVALGAKGEELLWVGQPGSDKGKCPGDFRQLLLASSQEAIREMSLWSAAAPFVRSVVA